MIVKTLYLGLNPPCKEGFVHYPMIKIIPLNYGEIEPFSHLIFTSKTAVELFECSTLDARVIAVGGKTAEKARGKGYFNIIIANRECAEGVIEILQQLEPKSCSILYPHSKKSRLLINDYLSVHGFKFQEIVLYDSVFQAMEPIPDLNCYEAIFFTSPSTVDAFLYYFKQIPHHLRLISIGEVTQSYLTKKLKRDYCQAL